MHGPITAPERVLPTLNSDGSRRQIRPKLYKGKLYRARRILGYSLILLFVALPLFQMNGKPLVLLDIPRREFTLFGNTFLATDGVLLMLLLLAIFMVVIWLTALVGRAWCGWACPQTVYMEFVFRPVERLFEGDRAGQLRIDRQRFSMRRLSKNAVFLVLSVLVANVFLAYFVGVEALMRWVGQSPLDHPTPFLVMGTTALLVFLDFGFFREQMCTVVCPYARLQSVLLDKRSLIVGYDEARGEPRGKGKARDGLADCVDCSACVVACPTGIDIRDGLQLECIACTQCIDACNSVMRKVKKPAGLIRYGSQQSLQTGERTRVLRPRLVIYSALVVAFVSALAVAVATREPFEVTILRGLGAPFALRGEQVTNQIRIKVKNRSSSAHTYRIELLDAGGAEFIAAENPLHVADAAQITTSVFVLSETSGFERGERRVRFRITDESGLSLELPYKLLGPKELE